MSADAARGVGCVSSGDGRGGRTVECPPPLSKKKAALTCCPPLGTSSAAGAGAASDGPAMAAVAAASAAAASSAPTAASSWSGVGSSSPGGTRCSPPSRAARAIARSSESSAIAPGRAGADVWLLSACGRGAPFRAAACARVCGGPTRGGKTGAKGCLGGGGFSEGLQCCVRQGRGVQGVGGEEGEAGRGWGGGVAKGRSEAQQTTGRSEVLATVAAREGQVGRLAAAAARPGGGAEAGWRRPRSPRVSLTKKPTRALCPRWSPSHAAPALLRRPAIHRETRRARARERERERDARARCGLNANFSPVRRARSGGHPGRPTSWPTP
jgi:hypothetical protein